MKGLGHLNRSLIPVLFFAIALVALGLVLVRFQSLDTITKHIAASQSLAAMTDRQIADFSQSNSKVLSYTQATIRSLLIGSMCLCVVAITSILWIDYRRKPKMGE